MHPNMPDPIPLRSPSLHDNVAERLRAWALLRAIDLLAEAVGERDLAATEATVAALESA